jgi:hypothetical protein
MNEKTHLRQVRWVGPRADLSRVAVQQQAGRLRLVALVPGRQARRRPCRRRHCSLPWAAAGLPGRPPRRAASCAWRRLRGDWAVGGECRRA